MGIKSRIRKVFEDMEYEIDDLEWKKDRYYEKKKNVKSGYQSLLQI